MNRKVLRASRNRKKTWKVHNTHTNTLKNIVKPSNKLFVFVLLVIRPVKIESTNIPILTHCLLLNFPSVMLNISEMQAMLCVSLFQICKVSKIYKDKVNRPVPFRRINSTNISPWINWKNLCDFTQRMKEQRKKRVNRWFYHIDRILYKSLQRENCQSEKMSLSLAQ